MRSRRKSRRGRIRGAGFEDEWFEAECWDSAGDGKAPATALEHRGSGTLGWIAKLPQPGDGLGTETKQNAKRRLCRTPKAGMKIALSSSQVFQRRERVVEVVMALSGVGSEQALELCSDDEENYGSQHVSLSSCSAVVFLPQVTQGTDDEMI
ncbi:hypothetical protein NDU88_003414 [Pleurodeles waltl]|uniref:Uncharacterized protein n=1 Tax=Pleurodeles waltl TaxID=8319 RepID=A0AAV7UCG9_PLEWA|nr:hypothetical protein NDU88_003414 [Pleurodeles waltl]